MRSATRSTRGPYCTGIPLGRGSRRRRRRARSRTSGSLPLVTATPAEHTYTPIGVESLTPSQRRVSELAAGGMTNRQIAQTLFLTVKTIESHLAAAYNNLGIRSRGELAGALGR
jgi:DNA-binding NarL/FixJ family response regulator